MKNKAMQEAFVAWYEQDDTDSFAACWEAACAWVAGETKNIGLRDGGRQFTMERRNFAYAGNGFISDENFDFDAGFKVSGDFVNDDKDNYCRMIVAALNARAAPEALGAAKGVELSDAEIRSVVTDAIGFDWNDIDGEGLQTVNSDDLMLVCRAILAKAKGEQA